MIFRCTRWRYQTVLVKRREILMYSPAFHLVVITVTSGVHAKLDMCKVVLFWSRDWYGLLVHFQLMIRLITYNLGLPFTLSGSIIELIHLRESRSKHTWMNCVAIWRTASLGSYYDIIDVWIWMTGVVVPHSERSSKETFLQFGDRNLQTLTACVADLFGCVFRIPLILE